jgi:hypothetical protein
VRRLVGISEARRTGRGADAFLIEQDEQRFGFDAMEGDVRRAVASDEWRVTSGKTEVRSQKSEGNMK